MDKTNKKYLSENSKDYFFVVISVLISIFSLLIFAQTIHAQKRSYIIDASQSKVIWSIDAHNGEVTICKGSIMTEGNEIIDGHFEICMDSIIDVDIDYELMRHVLENTLKSKELFDAKKYPYASFDIYKTTTQSDSISMIYGDLVVKGIEKCITLEARTQFDHKVFKAQSGPIKIDRTDWGITAMSKKYSTSEENYIVSDTITLQVHITAIFSDN